MRPTRTSTEASIPQAMHRATRLAPVLLAAAIWLAGAPVDAQEAGGSSREPAIWHSTGLRVGVNVQLTIIDTTPSDGNEGRRGEATGPITIEEGGGGLNLCVGYAFTPSFILRLDLSGAVHESSLSSVEGSLSSAALTVQWMFRPEERARPYALGGLGGTTFRVDQGRLEAEIDGGTAVLGGGFEYSLSRHFALDFHGRLDFINWDRGTARLHLDDGNVIEVSSPFEETGVVRKLAIGAVVAF